MSSTRAALAFICLLFVTLTRSHKPGEEYTYMSMFMKPQTPDMVEGDNHLGKLYEQLSVHTRIVPHLQTRRILHGASKVEEQEQEEEEEEEEEETEEEQDADSQKGSRQTSRYSQENSEPSTSSLLREPIPDKMKLRKAGSQQDFDPGEEEEEDADHNHDPTPNRHSMSLDALKIRMKMEDAEKESQSQQEQLSKQLAKEYGEDLDRIQTMLLKIILKYDIESMADVPCRAHSHWMPKFLEMVVAKKKKFRYYCVDTNKDVLKSVKESVGTLAKSKFILRSFWRQGIPRADLVFSWAGLDNMRTENVLSYLTRLSKTGNKHKIIAIGSHSGMLKKKGSKSMIARFTIGGKPINVREKPFQLQRPMRIIGKLSTGGNDKQLYIYKTDDMMN